MFRRGSKAPIVRVVLTARAWRRVPMKLLKWGRKMPSTKQYNLVPNDEYDTRIPLHPDEAFSYGITFQAKYIGTMDVPRPTSRVEIVAAMRRVRYEFKAKGVKKRKVTVDVSTDGVRVTTRIKKNGKKTSTSKLFGRSKNTVAEGIEIMHHPIYRIFYVSHDSSDLKIFSYIARDGATNVFKCNVFKSNRKSQAMRIVRTVGQAFEVCHKMQVNMPEQPVPSTSSAIDEPVPTERTSDVAASKEGASECGASESGAVSASKIAVEEGAVGGEEPSRPKHLDLLPPPPRKDGGKKSPLRTTPAPNINLPELPECITKLELSNIEGDTSTPLSAQHQLQLLNERLEQQAQQTRAAVAQLLLLRDQLAAEQAARYEAQARTHQLLVHNKELLEHIAALVAHLQERERGSSRPISAQQLTLLPQMKVMESPTEMNKTEKAASPNGNKQLLDTESLINLLTQSNKVTQNVENNNIRLSPYGTSPNNPGSPVNGPKKAPTFDGMTNEEIQNYLIEKFQRFDFGSDIKEPSPSAFSSNQHFFQNSRAFPNIPPLTNHYSNSDLASLLDNQPYEENSLLGDFGVMTQPMVVGHSPNSLTNSKDTSKDSSPTSSEEGVPFIMPLSHNGTLTATGEDGRMRLIVPVSPSPSSSDVVNIKIEAPPESSGATLKVPDADRPNPAGPITRSTSEKVPNRSEMMTALRAQWTRHTTK
ncbi:capon-like protein isoform X2 [Hyposmocoma kahamanoa]|uniref:capon-like protein isoform X2 n=1 Tax=Hyposmocoma kahamanoa TaxID=1477025 RepID=UPI000E6DA542|nr:capon-like protein isoform X2 [Hyposmocoma kahamanoa]